MYVFDTSQTELSVKGSQAFSRNFFVEAAKNHFGTGRGEWNFTDKTRTQAISVMPVRET